MSVSDDWRDPSEEEEASPQPPAAVERLRRRRRRAQPLIPWWLLALAGLVVVLAIALLWVWAAKTMKESKDPPTIVVTPTFTQVIPTATIPPADTATPLPPTDTPVPPTPTTPAQVTVGGWVKVIGTGTLGLSLRAGWGQDNVRLKIVFDGAVLKVLPEEPPGACGSGGYPCQDDGFSWWRLQLYEDAQPTVIGWAIDEYLVPTSPP